MKHTHLIRGALHMLGYTQCHRVLCLGLLVIIINLGNRSVVRFSDGDLFG